MTIVAKASNIVHLCYQLTKIFKFFQPNHPVIRKWYQRSKPEVCKTNAAKVSKIVLLCYQLTKISTPRLPSGLSPGYPPRSMVLVEPKIQHSDYLDFFQNCPLSSSSLYLVLERGSAQLGRVKNYAFLISLQPLMSLTLGKVELSTLHSRKSEAQPSEVKLTLEFHHLPSVGPKQLCVLSQIIPFRSKMVEPQGQQDPGSSLSHVTCPKQEKQTPKFVSYNATKLDSQTL